MKQLVRKEKKNSNQRNRTKEGKKLGLIRDIHFMVGRQPSDLYSALHSETRENKQKGQ